MGFNKNPIAWVVVGALVLFVGYRFYDAIQYGDGMTAAIGLLIALVIVVVVLVVLNRSAAGQLEGVTAMKQGSLVKPVVASNASLQVNKAFARSRGRKAKGLMTAQVASFDREAATLWTGGKQPRIAVSVPASEIRAVHVRKVNEGMRNYNAVMLLTDPSNGILLALKDSDDALQPAIAQIVDALGLDRSLVQFS